ncbi:MAG: 2,3-bisphosphoglycerate-independent phosphoglycerate mutase [Candidatus Aminicenantales bacterium]
MMSFELLQDLSVVTPSKIVLLVLDGLGGLPVEGKTALEAAQTPHLDRLAKEACCGLTDPVGMGITPGSGPAHLALFGYDPTIYVLGRGILEALGVGVEVGKDDLVARGNFATLQDGKIIDRRAGRIPTAENERLCGKINAFLKNRPGPEIMVFPGKEHRFVVKFSGKGLSDALTDADPQKAPLPPAPARPLNDGARETAAMVNAFIQDVTEFLKGSSPANTLLLRGFSKHPSLPSIEALYKLKPAALAAYPMYRGLARLVGMDVLDVGSRPEHLFERLEEAYDRYTFFYVHLKSMDRAGEDGDFAAKVEAIEQADSLIPRVTALSPDVFVVTSDHSTPCPLKSHSWHPNPFLLHAPTAMPDSVERFTERACSHGFLGRFPALHAMALMMAHAGKLKKYGA